MPDDTLAVSTALIWIIGLAVFSVIVSLPEKDALQSGPNLSADEAATSSDAPDPIGGRRIRVWASLAPGGESG